MPMHPYIITSKRYSSLYQLTEQLININYNKSESVYKAKTGNPWHQTTQEQRITALQNSLRVNVNLIQGSSLTTNSIQYYQRKSNDKNISARCLIDNTLTSRYYNKYVNYYFGSFEGISTIDHSIISNYERRQISQNRSLPVGIYRENHGDFLEEGYTLLWHVFSVNYLYNSVVDLNSWTLNVHYLYLTRF